MLSGCPQGLREGGCASWRRVAALLGVARAGRSTKAISAAAEYSRVSSSQEGELVLLRPREKATPCVRVRVGRGEISQAIPRRSPESVCATKRPVG